MAQPSKHEIFNAAADLPDKAERAAFLDRACAGNEALRAEVEDLLRHDAEAGSFLQSRPPEFPTTSAERNVTEASGAFIGPYKLLQQIGEGGMGAVYMAEQTHPVHRKVALKLIKAGMDSRQVISRFEAERQALAMMDHVNIARVFDGGTTETARPYFVMELVHGVPITRYCDDNRLTPRQRLELFVPVCQAIQHAHQKGIIHRDIKPSNVMITLYDGKPVPKVIDFGVAKATEQRLTERTLFTQYGTMVGTLEYMSPEQAEMSALGVDTRSDIYSLGVLLYELLTGSTPLSHKRMNEAAYAEILRMIKEEEPPKPSTRLSDSGDALASISARRHTEPAKLTKLVRGDLDWIVMKTLEKDRNRRYETANGLALDIQRYLADEPVEAGRPSAAYRFRKFARRNKAALATSVVVAATLIVATGISAWQASRAFRAEVLARKRAESEEVQRKLAQQHAQTAIAERRGAEVARQDAEAQRDRAIQAEHFAEANFRKAGQAVDEYFTLVSESQLLDVPGLQPLRKRLLEAALRYYLGFLNQRSSDPRIRAELAAAYLRVAQVYQQSNETDKAVLTLERGLEIVEQLVRENPQVPDFPDRLAGLRKSGRIMQYFELWPTDAPEALRVHRKAAAIWESFAREHPAIVGFQSDLASHYRYIGNLQIYTKQPAEALESCRKACQIWDRLARENPGQPEYRADLAESLNYFALALRDVGGRQQERVEAIRQGLALREKLVAECPGVPEYRAALANNFRHLGVALFGSALPHEAEAAFRRSLEIWETLAAEFPGFPGYRKQWGRTHYRLGKELGNLGQFAEAEKDLRQALDIQLKLSIETPGERGDNLAEARNTLVQLASLWNDLGRPQDAETVYRDAVKTWQKSATEFPAQLEYRVHLSHAQTDLAEVLFRRARRMEVDTSLSEAERQANALACRAEAGELLRDQEKHGQQVSQSLNSIAWHLVADPNPNRHDPGLALELSKLAVQGAPDAPHILNTLGVALYRTGDWTAAIDPLKKADALDGGRNFSANAFFIAMAHWQRGEQEQARKWYAPAVVWMDKHASTNDELRRFRAEAASLLSLPAELMPELEQVKADDLKFCELVLEANAGAAWAYRDLALIHAKRGEWDQARRDLARAADLSPDRPLPRHEIALVRLAIQDEPGYRLDCAAMLQRFSRAADPNAAYWTVWTCVLAPAAVTDWQPVVQLAEKSLATDPTSFEKLQRLGATLYRAGRFEEAAQRLTEAEAAFKETRNRQSSIAYTRLFLAMAQHRMGLIAEAGEQLDSAIGEIEKSASRNTTPALWNRRLTLKLLRNETENLLRRSQE